LIVIQELREYVEKHPVAGLKELQSHLQSKFNTEYGRPTISRRMKDLGYALSIVSRGATSVEKENLPDLSQEDRDRLLQDPVATEAMAGRGTVYAWLKNTKPVPRRQGARPKRKRASGDTQESHVENDGEDPSEDSETDLPDQDVRVHAPGVNVPVANGSSLLPAGDQNPHPLAAP
jgi:transposase